VSAWASTRRAIELAGDQLAIPAQDRVRSGYGGDVGYPGAYHIEGRPDQSVGTGGNVGTQINIGH
jgi:hypothetical protein